MSATLASLWQLDEVSHARDGNIRDVAPNGVGQEVYDQYQNLLKKHQRSSAPWKHYVCQTMFTSMHANMFR